MALIVGEPGPRLQRSATVPVGAAAGASAVGLAGGWVAGRWRAAPMAGGWRATWHVLDVGAARAGT